VYQHGRLCIPVGLGADIDVGNDDVDIPPAWVKVMIPTTTLPVFN
jgi:hypothetical protein